jgi:hypothetical protein
MSECTEKTLPSGERVRCHPDGRQVLIPSGSLQSKMHAAREDNCAAHAELRCAERERLRKAKESLSAGESVPFEKRCI